MHIEQRGALGRSSMYTMGLNELQSRQTLVHLKLQMPTLLLQHDLG